MGSSLSVKNISKGFGINKALVDVSLNIKPGEFVSLLGPSGCGKSTLLRIIAGLLNADQGDVALNDASILGLRPNERNIAMVFQNYALYPHMSVHDNIATPLMMSSFPFWARQPLIRNFWPGNRSTNLSIDEKVLSAAKGLQIEMLLDRKPSQLSGGQRQRVALARAMVRSPAVFLMDEPLSNLDAKLRIQIREELSQLHKSLGATFLYVTHDQTEALTLSDRVAVMDAGQVLQFDTPQNLYQKPANLTVAQFIGSPQINCWEMKADSLGRLNQGEWLVQGNLQLSVNSKVTLALRPEQIQVSLNASEFSQVVDLRVKARVTRLENHGPEWIFWAEPTTGKPIPLIVRASTKSMPKISVGDILWLGWLLQDCLIFDPQGQRLDINLIPGSQA
jgi:multiple sugar transport system ATP-binding protein